MRINSSIELYRINIFFTILLSSTYIYAGYNIKVTNDANCSKQIGVESTYSVDKLKELVKKEFNLNEDISLKYNGEILEGFKKLDSYKIYNGSVVNLISSYNTHRYTDYVVEVEPSCNMVGRKVRKCTICGRKEVIELPKKEHDFTEYKIVSLANCRKEGLKQRTCNICGEVQEVVLPKYKHKYKAWKIIEEPTCEKVGKMQRECMYCSKIETITMSKLGHDIVSEHVNPTCTEKGMDIKKCSRENCDYIESKVEIPATGHKMSDWKIEQDPTLVEEGKQVRVCLNKGCKHKEEKELASIVKGGDQTMFVNAVVNEITKPENSTKVAIVAFAMLIPIIVVFIRDVYISSKNKYKEKEAKKD